MNINEFPEGIDLGKMPCWPQNEKWIGKKLCDVIEPDSVEKIILLMAVTSAPANIDFMGIFHSISSEYVFEKKPDDWHENYWIYDAILITDKGKYFHFHSNHDWIYLISQTAHGFARKSEKQKTGL